MTLREAGILAGTLAFTLVVTGFEVYGRLKNKEEKKEPKQRLTYIDDRETWIDIK